MLKSLAFQVTFSTGVSIDRLLTPEQKGSTLITGKNEAGKSLNLEMFAYTLFGSDALRGKLVDYKKLKASSTFEIKGTEYEVFRGKRDAKLLKGTEILAEGVTPVNNRIKEILGFGLDVFKISNWCAQGDIQKLANMMPTERKQMIDEVSGLTQIDSVISWVKDHTKQLRASANAKAEVLVKPVEPTKPEGIASKPDLLSQMAELNRLNTQRAELKVKVNHKPLEPVKPPEAFAQALPEAPKESLAPPLPTEPSFDESKSYGWDEISARNCQAFALAMPAWLVRKLKVEAEIDVLQDNPVESLGIFSWGLLDKMVVEHQTFNEQTSLKAEREALEAKGEVECPKCHHSHYIAGELLKAYPTTFDLVVPKLTLNEISDQRAFLRWEEKLKKAKEASAVVKAEQPMPEEDFENYRNYQREQTIFQHAMDSFKDSMSKHVAHVAKLKAKDLQAALLWDESVASINRANASRKETFDNLVIKYNEACEQHDHDLVEYQKVLASLEAMESYTETNEKFLKAQEGIDTWTHYNFSLSRYNRDLVDYKTGYAEYEKLADLQSQYEQAGKALAEVKLRVKGYLVPSLSKVSSQLLSEMTGGERCSIKISEDFEIVVDGQRLQTLSGSGKDIANLAIRIALGQVLTHKVMPIMMFDEIDAAMDDTRASFTWDCIQKVTDRIGQVLLVSHKDLHAQSTIEI